MKINALGKILACAAVLGITAGTASAADRVLKIQTSSNASHASLAYLNEEWVPKLEAMTGGAITVELLPVDAVVPRRETAEAAAFPADEEEGQESAPDTADVLGLTLSEITPEVIEEYQLSTETGLVITAIDPDSEAASKGLLPGDLITEAGQRKVESLRASAQVEIGI